MITRQNAEALFTEDLVAEIIQGVTKQSAALRMFRPLPKMSSSLMRMRVLDALPLAYWVNDATDNGRKKLTEAAWANKYIVPAEIAVIVPIKEDVLDDASIDIWGEIRPRLVEAFGKKIDQAIFAGVDKPSAWRADLLSSIAQAGAYVAQSGTLYSAINDAMVKVEESGYNPTGIVGGVDVKGKFRMMLDTSGQPIKGTEIDELPKAYIDNGAWDKTKAQMIIGDFTQAVYSIRQDISYKILDQAIIQDPSTGDILYNLAQEDMVALRVTMRLGWEIPNPINALAPDESKRFPFAAIQATSALTTNTVTFTVTDDGATGYVEGARVSFGGMVAKTNASGVATFKTQNGVYQYKITANGYQPYTGSVTVDGTEAVPVTLSAKS